MRATNMKNSICGNTTASGDGDGGGVVLHCDRACCGSWHHRPNFQSAGVPCIHHPARWSDGLFLGLRLQRRTGLASLRLQSGRTFCSTMQLPGPTLIVTQGQTVTVNLLNNLPDRGRQHLDSVPRLQGDYERRRGRAADAGSGARRHRDLHIHRVDAGNPLLLQRDAERPASGDGTVRRDHRRPEHRSGRLHIAAVHASKRGCASRTGVRTTSDWRRGSL